MNKENLLKEACNRCENYAKGLDCEDKDSCPVYKLYLMVKESNDNWDTTPRNNEVAEGIGPIGII